MILAFGHFLPFSFLHSANQLRAGTMVWSFCIRIDQETGIPVLPSSRKSTMMKQEQKHPQPIKNLTGILSREALKKPTGLKRCGDGVKAAP